MMYSFNRPVFFLLAALATASPDSIRAQQPQPNTPPKPTLKTRWAADVNPNNVLPDYPRPQMVRKNWVSLNGRWEYAIRDTSAGATTPAQFDGTILVPFAVESQLSGVQKTVSEKQYLWYRRTFRAPALANGSRLLLHFGAVDWRSTIYVNGKQVGTHEGGFDPFTVDVTDALSGVGDQTLTLKVWDPTDKGAQPRGKQIQNPSGIFYTPVTGIWQTVWLEAVPKASIRSLTLTPDVANGALNVTANVVGAQANDRVKVTVRDGSRTVGSATGTAGQVISVRVPNAKLWSPSNPFLYNVDVSLSSGDKVTSYAGMRSIEVAKDKAGTPRLMLNGEPLFQYGLLDQGWWPDGLYTAPTDEALKFDIAETKRLGFNMIRKHIKVEPARWYHYADSIGVLIWQDMPSGNMDTREGKAAYRTEIKAMIDGLRSHPSIVVWVPFNEGWGQHDTEFYARWVKQYDPSRIVNSASGWVDLGAGDLTDAHVYPGPGLPLPDTGSLVDKRAIVLGEFGGLGMPVTGHTWVASDKNWGYRTYSDTTQLYNSYRDLIKNLGFLINEGLSAAVYTQTTDVETEVNGIMTYDRAVIKLPKDIPSVHATLYQLHTPVLEAVLPAYRNAPTGTALVWRYTFDTPDTAWATTGFNDGSWKKGIGGFGQPVPPGYARMPLTVGTVWETPEIWMRGTFTLNSIPEGELYWRANYMVPVDVYLNGKFITTLQGGSSGYRMVPFDSTAKAALKTGENTLALYARRLRPLPAMQYLDIGIDRLISR